MARSTKSSVIVLLPGADDASWETLFARLKDAQAKHVVIVLSGKEELLLGHPPLLKRFLDTVSKHTSKVSVATKHAPMVKACRKKGIIVVQRARELKQILATHPQLNEALRRFSPHIWRQHLTSHLQRLGLLSMPRLRVYALVGLSVLIFFFVFFELLPSAEVKIVPRQEASQQTMNIFLYQSGAVIPSERVARMELEEITVQIEQTLTFAEVSKEFTGESSRMEMTVVNESNEPYALQAGTRFLNEAGMVFRSQAPLFIEAGSQEVVLAIADDLDVYQEVIGERGNLPAGVRWKLPGLRPDEQKMVYATNLSPGQGGMTSYRTVLKEGDLELAKKALEQQLQEAAKRRIDEQRILRNADHATKELELLDYDVLTLMSFTGFVLPTNFLGQEVNTVPVKGSIVLTMFAYDSHDVVERLSEKLITHVRDGRRLLDDTLSRDRLDVRVVDYEDDLSWIKITVELVASEEYVLDPLTPEGALFAKHVRERIAGLSRDEALRIVKNFPEVEQVDIDIWPPWRRGIPSIPSHINVVPE